MAKKRKASVDAVPADRLDALVRQRVNEALATAKETALFEPWFRSKKETAAMRARMPVPRLWLFSRYFEKWGCMVCRRKRQEHSGLGLCIRCKNRIYPRLRAIMRELADEWPAARTREEIEALDKPIRTARLLLRGPEEGR